ncbi:MAG: SpoIVB peptidase [Clostridiales bacterium]|nr:SpoIVB peptidase [Clostridiales bacterium]
MEENRKKYRRFLMKLLAVSLVLLIGYGGLLFARDETVLGIGQNDFKVNFVLKQNGYSEESSVFDIEKRDTSVDSRQSLVETSVSDHEFVYACGKTVGVYLQTNGVLVVGTGKVTAKDGSLHNPAEDIVKEGDYIVKVNGISVSGKNELVDVIRDNGADSIELTIRRDGEMKKVAVDPVLGTSGQYLLGIWVRDDTQGIGTLTFVTEDGTFGALGHAISDTDTGVTMESGGGALYSAKVTSILRGKDSIPGALCGKIYFQDGSGLGEIKENCSVGIYGTLYSDPETEWGLEKVPVGTEQDITTGKAMLRSDVSGMIEDYEIEILRLDSGNRQGKNMVIRITDPDLLDLTGGIVQGMSGSPIIQNGKIVGAVTHVLVNDPTRGYGVFIENMLDAAG